MTIPTLTPTERRELAAKVGTTDAYLYQVLTGRRTADAALARQIHEAYPRIDLQDLRPDDWQQIWPELALASTQEVTHG